MPPFNQGAPLPTGKRAYDPASVAWRGWWEGDDYNAVTGDMPGRAVRSRVARRILPRMIQDREERLKTGKRGDREERLKTGKRGSTRSLEARVRGLEAKPKAPLIVTTSKAV